MRAVGLFAIGLAGCATSVGVKNENPDLAFDIAAFFDNDSGNLFIADGSDLSTVPHDMAGQPPHDLAGAGCTTINEPLTTSAANWQLLGNAAYDATNQRIDLTLAGQTKAAGTAFYTTAQNVTAFHATFKTYIGGGTGSDGMAFLIAQAQGATPAGPNLAPTGNGGALGFAGMNAWAVQFDTSYNDGDPSGNYVGFMYSEPSYVAHVATGTPTFMLSCGCQRQVDVLFTGTDMTVTVDGTVLISAAPAMVNGVSPAFSAGQYYFGFAGATGSSTDTHAVSDVHITQGPVGCL